MNRWRTQVVALGVVLILGTVYLQTLPPGPTWGDGLEFTVAVHTLGIPHPTGYPLYVLLGKGWELAFPLGELAWRLHVFSALWGIVAALLLFGLVREAMPPERDWEDVPMPHEWRRVLIPGGAALAWGLTPAVWQSANIAEVYTLFAVFLHGIAWLMLRSLRDPLRWGDQAVALLCGLSLTHHRLIVVLLPLVLAHFAVRLVQRRRQGQGVVLWLLGCILAGLLGLTPILFLILRSRVNPPLDWGDPSTIPNLIWVLRGGDYMNTKLLATNGIPWPRGEVLPLVLERIQVALAMLVGEFVPQMTRTPLFSKVVAAVILFLMALGWWQSRRALRWGVPTVLALSLVMVGIYNIPDFQSYLIPVVTCVWLMLALGVTQAAEWVESLFLRRRFTYTPLVLGLLPLWLAVRFWDVCDRSDAERADLWAQRVLEQVEPDSLLLTRGDGDIYALWHAQLVEDRRPDVTVFGTNFMWSGWYRQMFTEEELDSLHIEDLDSPADARYFLAALVGGVVAPSLEKGWPVFTCFNLYESQGDLLLHLWQSPSMFGEEKYPILILDAETRDPDARSPVAPPPNPLLYRALSSLSPGVLVGLGGEGEPSPLLFRVVDNPQLTALARQLFEEEVAPGYAQWRRQRTGALIQGAFFGE